MKRNRLFVFFLTMAVLFPLGMIAQVQVRHEDRFWARRIVNRIPFNEKINAPLVHTQSAYYGQGGRFAETDGIVAALLNGLKTGAYQAYHPDDWKQKMDWSAVELRMREFEAAISVGGSWEEENDWMQPETDHEFGPVPGGDDVWNPENQSTPAGSNAPAASQPLDLGPYQQVMHLVEDRIFDKNRSMMTFALDHVEVIWQDPTGALPEKVLARFRIEEVRPQLEKSMWKNRFNDAEVRSIAEVLDLRIFRGYMISVGGEPVTTLMEAERRRQELIEFEHHLWVY